MHLPDVLVQQYEHVKHTYVSKSTLWHSAHSQNVPALKICTMCIRAAGNHRTLTTYKLHTSAAFHWQLSNLLVQLDL